MIDIIASYVFGLFPLPNQSYLFIDIHIYIGNEVLAETAEMVSYYSEKWTQG